MAIPSSSGIPDEARAQHLGSLLRRRSLGGQWKGATTIETIDITLRPRRRHRSRGNALLPVSTRALRHLTSLLDRYDVTSWAGWRLSRRSKYPTRARSMSNQQDGSETPMARFPSECHLWTRFGRSGFATPALMCRPHRWLPLSVGREAARPPMVHRGYPYSRLCPRCRLETASNRRRRPFHLRGKRCSTARRAHLVRTCTRLLHLRLAVHTIARRMPSSTWSRRPTSNQHLPSACCEGRHRALERQRPGQKQNIWLTVMWPHRLWGTPTRIESDDRTILRSSRWLPNHRRLPSLATGGQSQFGYKDSRWTTPATPASTSGTIGSSDFRDAPGEAR